jgi:hypothetical protein
MSQPLLSTLATVEKYADSLFKNDAPIGCFQFAHGNWNAHTSLDPVRLIVGFVEFMGLSSTRLQGWAWYFKVFLWAFSYFVWGLFNIFSFFILGAENMKGRRKELWYRKISMDIYIFHRVV